jgi:3-isopropylmalate/(R)-2-methylmalate dehydratase large subunit
MGQTVIEKILAAHAGIESCSPGEILWCNPDLIMGHDLSASHAFEVFKQFGIEKVRNESKIVLVQDHFQPAKDVPSAGLAKTMRDFAARHHIKDYFEVGKGGICHILLLEKGLVMPGTLIAGADSHICTCGALGAVGWGVGATDMAALLALGRFWLIIPKTRKVVLTGAVPEYVCGKDIALFILMQLGQEGAREQVMEFAGNTFDSLPMVDRVTIANMAVEAGASSAILPINRIVEDFLAGRVSEKWTAVESDPDAEFAGTDEVDVSSLGPMVAEPFSPANVRPVEDFADVAVDQVYLGSCTNGWVDDFRRFAEVLGNRRFAQGIRVLASPATQETYRRVLEEGILERIVEAGGAVLTPSCGPCIGAQCGVLGADEVCLSTSNRNYRGRMGHLDSRVYLASPAVAAATAITGRITHPAEVRRHD